MYIKLYSFLAALTFVFTTGCSSTQSLPAIDKALAALVIAEPLPITFESEVTIARLSEMIYRAEITDEQRARLFFDRGVIYDSVGLRSLARFDFNRAINLKPDYVEAYNFLGIQFLQLKEFAQAFDAFDAAIELKPEHEYAYLNRGTALYYGGRANLAISDLNEFYKRSNLDPYRIIWLYLAQYDIDPVYAQEQLKQHRSLLANDNWAVQILQLFLGEISEQVFINNLTNNIDSNRQLVDRLCEAYFYLGKYQLMHKNYQKSASYFKLALSTNVYEFVEHRYAKLELDNIRDTLRQQAN